jgi:choline dehydrogenase-like flavoprotein
VDFWLSTEDLPMPGNRVTLTGEGQIKLSYTATNVEPRKRLYHQLKSMLGRLGMHPEHHVPHHAYLQNPIPVAGVAHQAVSCRLGTDPSTSVLDVDCKAHELDSLYVVDTSCFPSIGAVNPALTAIANSLRAATTSSSAWVQSARQRLLMPPETSGKCGMVIGGGAAADASSA